MNLNEEHDVPPRLGRRGWLAALGAAGLAVSAPALTAGAARAPHLALTAQTTEGPYYLDVRRDRADITEGLQVVPLAVCFTVLDRTGQPLRDLRVDLWHCDAQGRYSGFAGQGDDGALAYEHKTFLRGTQHSDAAGAASFQTIYPGWYSGRTTHIHFKVFNGTRAVLTSQFFLPDALSEFLYTQASDYRRGQLRDTLNSADGIALTAGQTVLGAVREERERYVASLTVVVDPAAAPVVDRPPRLGALPGPGPGMGAGGPPPGFVPGFVPGAGPAGPPPGMAGGPPHPVALQGDVRIRALLPEPAKV